MENNQKLTPADYAAFEALAIELDTRADDEEIERLLEMEANQDQDLDCEVCDQCNGTGVYGTEGNPDEDRSDQWNDIPCSVCGGSGYLA
jgi:DnaJ-class molecular chaperone